MNKYIITLFALLSIGASNTADQDKINNLVTFAKAYGYVKYFHPSNEASNIDWKIFSAHGAEEIRKCNSQAEVINTLTNLFKPIGPGIIFSKSKQHYDLKVITPKSMDGYQPTYWQHLGVSTNHMVYQYPASNYRSIRVNQIREVNESERYGNLFTSIDIEKYKSKEVKYTGWVKVKSDSKGTGHLWMRIYKSDKSAGFFANMDANPITSTEWKQFEIIGAIDDLASSVTFGSYLLGKGTLYFDDLELFYKENNEWVEIPTSSKGFEADSLGVINDQSEWTTKGEGYIHQVSDSESKEGEKCAVIEYRGKFKKEMGDTIFDSSPKFGELIEKEISDGIFCQIPLTLYGNAESTYPKSNNLSALQSRLDLIEEDPKNLYVRLGNVINTYNVFQHFYPYFDVVDVDWDKELETALKRSFDDEGGDDHLITLQKFTSPLKDGHITVNGGDKLYNFMPSIFWQWIEDKLVITNIFDENLNLQIGDVVTKIDNISTEDYFQEAYSRISSATKGYLNHRAQISSLLGEKDTELTIEVDSKIISLNRDKVYEAYSFSEITIQKNTYKLLDDDIIYLNLDVIDMDGINKLLPQLSKAKGIICDFRGYSYSVYGFLSHLISEDIFSGDSQKVLKIIYPDQENIIGYKDSGSGTMEAKEPYLGDKKVVFIIDGRAISAAEGIMNPVKNFSLATIIGQPTAGTNGMINPFRLLGNYTVYWTGMKVTNSDGSQFHGVGVLPDIYVEKTIEGVMAGKDEFLEKAIEIINK